MGAAGRLRWGFGLAALLFYLVYHTVSGPSGLASFMALQERERALQARLSDLTATQAALNREIAQFSRPTLDRAALEARARELVGALRPDERLLVLPAA